MADDLSALQDLHLVVDPAALQRAGLLAVELVLEQTAAGIDRHGQPFRPYSTRRLAVPAGSITKAAQARLGGALEYFTTARTGALWALVEGGYAALKAARYPQDGGAVNLHATGAMMRSMGVVAQDDNSVTIGFTRTEEAQKAGWNIETRDFLGLTDAHAAEVGEVLGAGVSLVSGPVRLG
jgi:hypothetical protein